MLVLESPRLLNTPAAFDPAAMSAAIGLAPNSWSTLGGPDVTAFLKEQNIVVAVVLVLGMSLTIGAALGTAAVWAIQRARGEEKHA
jgi:hypothetical protein